MKKHTWKIIIAFVLLSLGASVVYSQQVAKEANEGVVLEDHIRGNPDAVVTLTEYSDFQCPACGQFFPVVHDIMSEYGDQIRFEYKHFPLISIHPFAIPAARAAESAAQQGKFWEMHDALFKNQTVWANSAAPQVYFDQYAEEIGLDMDTFKRHMNASVITDSISDDFREAQDLGLRSTPTFFLNGEQMSFNTFESFVEQIESAIGIVPVDDSASSTDSTAQQGASTEFGI